MPFPKAAAPAVGVAVLLVPPLATGSAVVKLRLNALTARPAVRSATETCLVVVP